MTFVPKPSSMAVSLSVEMPRERGFMTTIAYEPHTVSATVKIRWHSTSIQLAPNTRSLAQVER